jgi:transmembrane sensor
MNAQRADSESAKQRRREATLWYMERRAHPELPPSLAREWEKWIADPANRAEYESIQRFLTLVRSCPRPPLPERAEYLTSTRSEEFETVDAPGVPTGRGETTHVTKALGVMPRVLVAVVCVAAAAGVLVLRPGSSAVDWLRMTFAPASHYETAAGEIRTILLEDQSTVTLAGSTRVKVLYSDTRRRVVLERGEAFFDVKHNPRVPFEVQAGRGDVTVLGTAFDVHRYPDDVKVAVKEGAVKVSADGSASWAFFPVSSDRSDGVGSPTATETHTTEVQAGHEVNYGENGKIGAVQQSAMEEVASWLYGSRTYRDRSLVRVIEDLQLYLSRRIDLDPDMSAFLITTRIDNLDSARVEEWIHRLPSVYPIEIDESNPRILRIRCRVPGCTN